MKKFILFGVLVLGVQGFAHANILQENFMQCWYESTNKVDKLLPPIQKKEPSRAHLNQQGRKLMAILNAKNANRLCFTFDTENDFKKIKKIIEDSFSNEATPAVSWRYYNLSKND